MSRKPNVPCALCGVLLWAGKGCLPADVRVCRNCRRARPLHTVALPPEGVRANRAPVGPPGMDGQCSVCDRPMFRNRRSNPDGKQVCHPCRRAAPGVHPNAARREVEHVCVVCSAPFRARSKQAKYCTPYCRFATRDGRIPRRVPTVEERRYYERNRKSTTDRGLGTDWMKIRDLVIDEESNCGFCGDPVDKALKWPDPLSASVDHIVRRRDGGTNARDNLRLAHVRCNAADGGRAHGQPRFEKPCEVCSGPFRASHDKQRTCSRTCGWVLRRRNAA